MLNLSAHTSDVPLALANRRGWEYFDQKLTALRVNDVENIMERGRLLIEAADELERGSYEATVKRHFDLSYARKLRIIAAHPVLSHRSHANALPPHPETLYQLSKLPEDALRAKLKDGSINPKTERRDVARWRAERRGEIEVDGKTIKRKPSVTEQLKAAKTEIDRLKQIVGGEHLFDPNNTSDRQIAETMIGRLQGWHGRAQGSPPHVRDSRSAKKQGAPLMTQCAVDLRLIDIPASLRREAAA